MDANNKGVIHIVLIVIVVILLISVLIVSGVVSVNKNNTKVSPHHCEITKYSEDHRDFLSTYTVAAGDTLLSIATNELDDVSRVSELVELNNEKFPSLSVEKPFIEVGWKLFLPPKSTTSTSGRLSQTGGWILDIISTDPYIIEVSSNSGSHFTIITLNSDTNMPENYTPTIGECISVIKDAKYGDAYVLKIQ